nr:glycoside hydrolase [Xanthomonadaceae bacterium]
MRPSPFPDRRVTSDDLTAGPRAATAVRSARSVRLILSLALAGVAGPLPAAPAPEPAPVVPEPLAVESAGTAPAAATPAPAGVPGQATQGGTGAGTASGGLRRRADAAASATLAALLPHLGPGDGLPLLESSANFAGDVNRLLAATQQEAGQDATAPPAQAEGRVQQVLKAAVSLLGTPYRWGGSSPDSGFDCSGLVSYVFRSALGIELPRASREMAAQVRGELIRDRDRLNPGDLVFFGPGRINHVGIYVGNGMFLHAPSRGKDVRVDSLASGYWANRFLQARRVEPGS